MDRNWPELLATQLDAMETVLRDDLRDPRTARSGLRQMDLADALEEVAAARAELTRCPDGARLALHVLDAWMHRLRLSAEYANTRYRAGLAGTAAANVTKRQMTEQRNTDILARAAQMSSELTPASKAELLIKIFPDLSVRQLRRIISPKT